MLRNVARKWLEQLMQLLLRLALLPPLPQTVQFLYLLLMAETSQFQRQLRVRQELPP
jgi:hypothetical protein